MSTCGQTSKPVTVLVNGDTKVEPTETSSVNLSGPSGASIADNQRQGTIVNDDAAALPSLSMNLVSHADGYAGMTAFTFPAAPEPCR